MLLQLFYLLFFFFNHFRHGCDLALQGSVFETFLDELADENLLLLAQFLLLLFKPLTFVPKLIDKLHCSTVHTVELKDLTFDFLRLFLEVDELLEMLVAFLLS